MPSAPWVLSSRPRYAAWRSAGTENWSSASAVRGDESCWSGDVGHDEAVEVVEHCSGDDLTERSVVALVRALKSALVRISLILEDDNRGVSESYEYEVQGESPGSFVAVDERVDAFEAVMESRQVRPHRRPSQLSTLGRPSMVVVSCHRRTLRCRVRENSLVTLRRLRLGEG